MTLDEAIQHCDDILHNEGGDCETAECSQEHRQLAVWLRQLRSIKSGKLDSLTDEEVYAIAATIDEMVDSRRVKQYYYSPRVLGNDQVSWYGASIFSKKVWHDNDSFYEEDDDRKELIPLPDGFSWRADDLIVNDSSAFLTEEEIDRIMVEHGFERAPGYEF